MRQVLLLTILLTPFLSCGQTRAITGKVIDEDLITIPDVRVQNSDKLRLGTTDINGNFKIELPLGTNELLLSFIGMEWTSIKVPMDCDNIEIIMLVDGTYDYMSNKKVDKERKKIFDEIPKLHSKAVTKGIFDNKSPCYTREFIPYKPQLDEITKELKVKRKQIRESFKELAIGDTIRIPFNGSYRDDGTERTTLNVWSYATDEITFDCIIEGVIIDKNNHNGDYNLIFKVIDCKSCKYDSIIYENKDMVTGAVFRHNMKYFKVLTE